jgi:hypothetical protein
VTRHLLRRGVAAALVVAASGVGVVLPATPASAAACDSAAGVTVIVDPHGLGGGVQVVCDPGGGAKAATLFTRNGFDLAYVQRQPGFVCRVDGAPASDPCVNTPPADAYWGLFWSDGHSGTWSYATTGVGSLSIPDGGYVAFSWQGSTAKALPGVTPAAHTSASASPSASPSPSHSAGGGHGNGNGSGGSATPSADASTAAPSSSAASGSASASPRHHRTKHASASPDAVVAGSTSPSAAAEVSDTTEPAAARTGDTRTEGLPGWVVPAVLVLLAGSAGGVAFVRRTRGAPPP